MTHRRFTAFLVSPVLVALGCASPDNALPLGSSGEDAGGGDHVVQPTPDGSTDVTPDTSADSSVDAPTDAPTDKGTKDVTVDVPVDTGATCPPDDGGTSTTCTPNTTQTVACGCNTGIKNRTCDATGHWGPWDACTGSPTLCQPCERRTITCGNCGTQDQVCDQSCSWSAATACVGSLACAPNTYQTDPTGCTGGQVKIQKCDSTCNWGQYGACEDPPGWVTIPTTALSAREYSTAVFTGTEMIVWGGEDENYNYLNTGARFDVGAQAWNAMATPDGTLPDAGAPDAGTADADASDAGGDADLDGADAGSPPTPVTLGPRAYHTAVWTGSEMIVWGGYLDSSYSVTDTGGRYDPSTDTWKYVSSVSAPSGRQYHSAVWSGTEMIVWGGEDDNYNELGDGGRYDPATDTWTKVATAPFARLKHVAVWDSTDHLMLVWGGQDSFDTPYADGARYDPTTNTWTAMSAAPLAARSGHVAVWDDVDQDLIVWGGTDGYGTDLLDGARYHPATDTWKPIASIGPTGFNSPEGATAVWGDGRMWIAGGISYYAVSSTNMAVSYDPASDTWSTLPTMANGRAYHVSVYAGHLYVWGGASDYGSTLLSSGEFLRAP